eukprot:scaffold20425_cov70-Phaeocystis_antarctica.AAC.2
MLYAPLSTLCVTDSLLSCGHPLASARSATSVRWQVSSSRDSSWQQLSAMAQTPRSPTPRSRPSSAR